MKDFGILHTDNGITLTELIVSLGIISVVMLGVVSSDYAIRKQAEMAQSGSLVAVNAHGILQHMITNAYSAVGSGLDSGISPAPFNPAAQSFCIRRHQDPEDSSSALIWACYTNSAGLANKGTLYYCTRSAPGDCVSGDSDYSNLGDVFSVTPVFQTDASQSTAQILFIFTVKVEDPSSTAAPPANVKSVSATVTPYNYSFTP